MAIPIGIQQNHGKSFLANDRSRSYAVAVRACIFHFALSLVWCTSTCRNNARASAFHNGAPCPIRRQHTFAEERNVILNRHAKDFVRYSRVRCLYAEQTDKHNERVDAVGKQKKRQQKGGKRRFAQTVHSIEWVDSSEAVRLSGIDRGKPKNSEPSVKTANSPAVAKKPQKAIDQYSEGKPKSRRRRTPLLPKSMVSKTMSIDDLEAKLSQRWDISNPQSKDSNIAPERNSKKGSHSAKGVLAFKSTPVYDPWMEDSGQPSSFRRGNNNVTKLSENYEMEISFGEDEFYDEDDVSWIEEGIESETFLDVDGLESAASNSSSPTVSVSHPVPGGGDGGFFFRSDEVDSRKIDREVGRPEQAKEKISASKQILSTHSPHSDEETGTVNRKIVQKKRDALEPLPLLDEHGKEQYLTLEMATRPLNLLSSALSAESGDEYDTDTFEDLGITSYSLLQNLKEMGCATPLPVQCQSCEATLEEKDVLISTHTGSGKTLAFLVPLIQRLLDDLDDKPTLKIPAGTENALDEPYSDSNNSTPSIKSVPIKSPQVKVIIVAPGRELAAQIVAVTRDLLSNTGVGVQMAIGGTPFSRCLDMIRKKKPALLVGTPGRIAELVVGREQERNGKVKVSSLQALVLDEFDALLEYSVHREPTIAIWDAVQRQHSTHRMQAILCSATAADIKAEKLKHFLHDDHVHISFGETSGMLTQGNKIRTSLTTLHGAVHLEHRRYALETVRRILHTNPSPEQVLIFVNNARRVGIVLDKLADMGIIAAPLHGGVGSDKGDRAEVSKALREGYVGVVVATEMAARGLDAPYLTHVINLDLPTDASHYAHRAGRCGRGGRPGVVVNITCDPKERRVPHKFADTLGVTMHVVDPRQGKIFVVDNRSVDKQ